MAHLMDDDYVDSDEDIKECKQHSVMALGHCITCGMKVKSEVSYEEVEVQTANVKDMPKNTKNKSDKEKEKAESTIANNKLISMASKLSIPLIAKQKIIEHINKDRIQNKINNKSMAKLLCVYGYGICISTCMLESTYTNYFNLCGLDKKYHEGLIKTFKKMGVVNKELSHVNEMYTHPVTYVKEYLYNMWNIKLRNECSDIDKGKRWMNRENHYVKDVLENFKIPFRYIIPPSHKDVVLFAYYVCAKDEEESNLIAARMDYAYSIKDEDERDEYLDKYLQKRHEADMEMRKKYIEDRKLTIDDMDKESREHYLDSIANSKNIFHAHMIDTPMRIAAAILYNSLMFDMEKISNIPSYRKVILDKNKGNVIERMYTKEDVVKSFTIPEKALIKLINKNCVRVMKNNVPNIGMVHYDEREECHKDTILIAPVGIPGIGKSTLMEMLYDSLDKKGKIVSHVYRDDFTTQNNFYKKLVSDLDTRKQQYVIADQNNHNRSKRCELFNAVNGAAGMIIWVNFIIGDAQDYKSLAIGRALERLKEGKVNTSNLKSSKACKIAIGRIIKEFEEIEREEDYGENGFIIDINIEDSLEESLESLMSFIYEV